VFALENTYTTLLDFGGINSGDAEGAIKRADKGGMVSAKQLRGLVTLLEGTRCAGCSCVYKNTAWCGRSGSRFDDEGSTMPGKHYGPGHAFRKQYTEQQYA
jgi:hypothetical protein